jgi:hypothetical protein
VPPPRWPSAPPALLPRGWRPPFFHLAVGSSFPRPETLLLRYVVVALPPAKLSSRPRFPERPAPPDSPSCQCSPSKAMTARQQCSSPNCTPCCSRLRPLRPDAAVLLLFLCFQQHLKSLSCRSTSRLREKATKERCHTHNKIVSDLCTTLCRHR